MSEWDWSPYLIGGGMRPDAMTGLADPFELALRNLYENAPPDVRANLRITSGYRSPEVQEKLWSDAVAKYGDEEIADNWVARPGQSNHNHGGAVDLNYMDPAAKEWAQANAGKFGLNFPMKWEPWHIELSGGQPAQAEAQKGLLPPVEDAEAEEKKNPYALLGKALMDVPQAEAPQIQPRQVAQYTPQKRDTLSPYLQLFQRLG